MKKISMKLSTSSIDKAIAELEAYEESLKTKTHTLVEEVALDIGVDAETKFNGAIYDDVLYEGTRVPNVEVTTDTNGDHGYVSAYGAEAVFAEFGAGVYYYSTGVPRPAGIKQIGTYGKGYGARKVWGYTDPNGNLKLTHGTPASHPMYFAARDEREKIPETAKKIFQSSDGG